MSLDYTKTMLETMRYYSDCHITQTFSKNQRELLCVCYIKETNFFEITYIETPVTETYFNIESAALAIEKAMNDPLPENL
ncbi:MAG TPA: hypothetical protein VEY51_14385 [Chondromyces sp.]|nr:hypothetical protein [Chondromyces sp.]